MKANFLVMVFVTASLASTVACAQGSLPDNPTYSHSELVDMVHTAHSPAQFNALADHFGQKQKEYLQKSADEQIELNRRIAAPNLSAKFATPVDSARALLGYYKSKAEEYGRRADAYRLEAKRADGPMSTLPAR